MDPEETLNAMMEAQALGLDDLANEYAESLRDWLDKGGFSPSFRVAVGNRSAFTVSGKLAKSFCLAACEFVLTEPPIEVSPELD